MVLCAGLGVGLGSSIEESEIPVPLIQLNDFWTHLVAVAPSTGKVLPTGEILACEQAGGGGKEKRKIFGVFFYLLYI